MINKQWTLATLLEPNFPCERNNDYSTASSASTPTHAIQISCKTV